MLFTEITKNHSNKYFCMCQNWDTWRTYKTVPLAVPSTFFFCSRHISVLGHVPNAVIIKDLRGLPSFTLFWERLARGTVWKEWVYMISLLEVGMLAVGKDYLLYWPRSALSTEMSCRIQLAPKPPRPRGTGTRFLDQSLKTAGMRTGCSNSLDCKAQVPQPEP